VLTEEKTYGNLTQDNAIAHASSHSVNEINQVFGYRVVSRGLLPPVLPDLNPWEIFICGENLKTMCKQPIHTVDELTDKIITRAEFRRVAETFL
jgi:hypothetical protein